MAQDISGFGLRVNLIASNTFPNGLLITQFSDDADAVDNPSTKIGETATGLNGDLLSWSKGVPFPVTISVVPDGPDDQNLAILANANIVGAGRVSAKDIITLTILYPDNSSTTYTSGKLTDAVTTSSVTSAGRKKTKVYGFAFEQKA